MKLKIFLSCLLVAALLCGCGSARSVEGIIEEDEQNANIAETEAQNPFWGFGGEADVEEEEEDDSGITVDFPYDYTQTTFFQMTDCWEYAPLAICNGINSDGSPFALQQQDGHHVGQAACSDGTYGYFFMAKPADGINPELQYIFKVDLSTWEIVQRSEEIYIQHANSACYNERTGKIYSVNQKPDGKVLTVINPDTLQPEGTVTVPMDICAIAYCAERNQYVVRLVGNYAWDFAILDANFQTVAQYVGVNSLLGTQNIFCDANYIYRLDSGCVAKPGTEGIAVYDWEGNFQGVYRIAINVGGANLMEVGETESIFSYNGEFYLSILAGSSTNFYRLALDLNELYW